MQRTNRPRGPRSSTNPPGVGASRSTPRRASSSSGGPELNPVMQRTNRPRGPRSSTNPPGVGASRSTPRRASSSSARYCSAGGVNGGTLPGGPRRGMFASTTAGGRSRIDCRYRSSRPGPDCYPDPSVLEWCGTAVARLPRLSETLVPRTQPGDSGAYPTRSPRLPADPDAPRPSAASPARTGQTRPQEASTTNRPRPSTESQTFVPVFLENQSSEPRTPTETASHRPSLGLWNERNPIIRLRVAILDSADRTLCLRTAVADKAAPGTL